MLYCACHVFSIHSSVGGHLGDLCVLAIVEQCHERWGARVLSGHGFVLMCVCAKRLQSCLTFYDPMNCSLPGSSVHGILQARILQWAAMPSSRGSSGPSDRTRVSYVSCTGRRVLYHYCHLGSNLAVYHPWSKLRAESSQVASQSPLLRIAA